MKLKIAICDDEQSQPDYLGARPRRGKARKSRGAAHRVIRQTNRVYSFFGYFLS